MTMSLSSASVTEADLLFSNNLILFVLSLKGKMQFFQLGVRLYIPGRERRIFQGADSGLLAVGDQWVLMARDGLVTAPQTLGALCALSPFCKAHSLVHSQEPGGSQEPDTKLPDSADLQFVWEHRSVVSSHYIPLSEPSAFPAGLKQDWLVETRGMAAAPGTLCFHGAKSLPGPLAVLHTFLGAEQAGREKGCAFHAPGMGRGGAEQL